MVTTAHLMHTESPKNDAGADPMRKIILMVGVAIVFFLIFMVFSVTTSVRNNDRLSDIKNLYFPVLERVDANVVRLDKIVERMTQAVMTGEKEELETAAGLASEADQAFAEMAERYVARQDDIQHLRTAFAEYHALAATTSTGFIENAGGDPAANMGKMNGALNDLRTALSGFRQSSYDNFAATLLDSQSAAKTGMYMGIAVGVMNLLFMGVLVFFIRNNVRMMALVAEQNATLEHRVAERTAELTQKTNDIHAMLHNMKLGVCTVVPGNRIHPEYSDYMRTIFDTDELANQPVESALLAASSLGIDSKDQLSVALGAIVGEDAMMFDFNGHLLAREMQICDKAGNTKVIQMDWSPIVNEQDCVDKVLLIVQDVTHLRELELESAHQKEELDLIAQIIRISIGKFNDFIASAHKFTAENRRLIEENQQGTPEVVAALFRNMHTIKGNARTYEFSFITDAAHAAEMEYDRLRKEPDAVWDRLRMLDELTLVDDAIKRYVTINEDKLGRKGRASDLLTTRGSFVSHEEIAQLKQWVSEAAKNVAEKNTADLPVASQVEALVEPLHKLSRAINHLGHVPLERLVSGAVDSLSSLAKELQKPTPDVSIVDGDLAFNTSFAEALKSSLMHIVRNSMDHGIESPESRVAAGKAAQGCIQFACRQHEHQLDLEISDDGRGLALHKLYEKGLAAGRFSEGKPSAQDVAELIFDSGLSTAEQLTQVSGRGVGMDAVRAFMGEQGASIRIALHQSAEEFGFTPFKFIISLPEGSFVR